MIRPFSLLLSFSISFITVQTWTQPAISRLYQICYQEHDDDSLLALCLWSTISPSNPFSSWIASSLSCDLWSTTFSLVVKTFTSSRKLFKSKRTMSLRIVFDDDKIVIPVSNFSGIIWLYCWGCCEMHPGTSAECWYHCPVDEEFKYCIVYYISMHMT